MERDKDADKLKEHIRILQEENFNRISQIADLQVEVNNLKVRFRQAVVSIPTLKITLNYHLIKSSHLICNL